MQSRMHSLRLPEFKNPEYVFLQFSSHSSQVSEKTLANKAKIRNKSNNFFILIYKYFINLFI